MNLYALPPHVPFLDAVAADWLQRSADPLQRAHGLILLPTRRAARSLAHAFLRASNGQPLLLPRITALGALDEAPLALAGALDLPPAIEPALRLAALSRLILARHGADGAPRTADRAWLLAGELALLMDEAEREEIDLATNKTRHVFRACSRNSSAWKRCIDPRSGMDRRTRSSPGPAAENPTRISSPTSQPPGEQHNASGVEEGCGRCDGGFEILGKAAVAIDPGKEPLDHPTPRQQLEANLVG